jgi:hypothetical protein
MTRARAERTWEWATLDALGVGARILRPEWSRDRGLARSSLGNDHTEGMQSRVHPTYKTKYRAANRASYDRALVRRGDVTVWVSPEAIATWEPADVEVPLTCGLEPDPYIEPGSSSSSRLCLILVARVSHPSEAE